MRVRKNVRIEERIINMTKHPIRMYDDASGDIVTFYPSVRTFCAKQKRKVEKVFPRTACYVFSPEAKKDIQWFRRHGGNVALIFDMGVGRGGVKIVTLIDTDYKQQVVYRRNKFIAS